MKMCKLIPRDEKYPKKINTESEFCEWIHREGNLPDTHFAFTPCKSGFNYLGESKNKRYADYWNNTRCPICGKLIHINYL
jgi:hypothetical protein